MRGTTATTSLSSLPTRSRNQSALHMDKIGYSSSPVRMGRNKNMKNRLSKSFNDLMFDRVNRPIERNLSIDPLMNYALHGSASKNEQPSSHNSHPKFLETLKDKMKSLSKESRKLF
jgi:hypothetical protein